VADCVLGLSSLAHAHVTQVMKIASKKIPMVDLPLGATEDRVCGTIDIEKALTEGETGLCACVCGARVRPECVCLCVWRPSEA
jgi:hypothetical protein